MRSFFDKLGSFNDTDIRLRPTILENVLDSAESQKDAGADMPSNYSRLIARELGLTPKSLSGLLLATGLSPEQFLRDDQRLTAAQQIQILRNAIRISPHADFGLRLGKRLTPATHGAMSFVANSSPNLLTATHAIQHFLPTRINFAHFAIEEHRDWLECAILFKFPMAPDIQRCLSETLIRSYFEIAEFLVGRAPDEAEIRFAHAPPEYRNAYARSLPGKIIFDSERLLIRLPMALCREPNASANHENYLLAMQQCEAMLAQLPGHSERYSTRIKKLMLSHPPGTLSEDEAAAALFINKRTLARKLAQESTGFRRIRDELLAQQAVDYLCQNRLSVEAVAALLNYHDSANFRRAFKRWYGKPPERYRQDAMH